MDKLFRNFPPFKGKERLARFLFSDTIKNGRDVVVEGRHSCSYLLPNIVENVGFDIFINGQYEPEIQSLICRLLPVNGCLLDLGANIGSIVIPVSKLRSDVKAVAVEAAPWIFSYLENNVKRNNLSSVQLVNKALFNEDDKTLDFFAPRDKFGKGSLSPGFTTEAISVNTIRLDTLVAKLGFDKVDLLKIDVEGFEYFVFKGAEMLLSGVDAPLIIFEFVDWAERKAMGLAPGAAQKLLLDFGYILYEIKGGTLIRKQSPLTTGSFNLLASKKELMYS